MSNARSPRLVCSITVGTSGLTRNPTASVENAAEARSLGVVLDAPDLPADYRLRRLGEQVSASSDVHADILISDRYRRRQVRAGGGTRTHGLALTRGLL